jgi:hypothetical protein
MVNRRKTTTPDVVHYAHDGTRFHVEHCVGITGQFQQGKNVHEKITTTHKDLVTCRDCLEKMTKVNRAS